MYGNTEGQTGSCWHSILRLWEGNCRFEIISCKRPQGKHDWPGYHFRLMWYSSHQELQAHSLRFPDPRGRWICEGLSEDKGTLWAAKGPPAVGMDVELSKHSQAVQGERIGDALHSLSESQNILKLRGIGSTWAKPPNHGQGMSQTKTIHLFLAENKNLNLWETGGFQCYILYRNTSQKLLWKCNALYQCLPKNNQGCSEPIHW